MVVVNAIAGGVSEAADGAQPNSVDLDLDLGSYRLTGKVGGLYGATLISASYSTLAPKHRIAGWVRLLALCSTGLGTDAKVIGRHNQAGKEVAWSRPPDPSRLLAALLDIRAAGIREPLPLGTATSYTYVDRLRSVGLDDARGQALKAWTSTSSGSFRTSGENDDKSISLVYGPDAPFSVWWDQTAPLSEQWTDAVPRNRFAQLSFRVYEPMIDIEQSRILR